MEVGAWINSSGTLESLIILDHRETPVFFEILEKRKYFDQYAQKSIQDPFQLHQDIDGISGATVSSRAIAEATQRSTHYWGRNHFKFAIEKTPMQWQIGANEFILIVLYAVIVISAVKKYRKIRYITLAFSIVFLGFYLSAPISISAFGALLMGYVPSISGQFFWWLLVSGAILMAVILGRNLYCTWACPFGGIQEFIHRAGGMSVRVHPAVTRWATKIVYFLFWLAFMVMFLTDNPAIGTFEPFAALFSFKGSSLQWYLVSVTIFGSFIIPRFWCRFFCPVGLVLKKLAKTQKQILKRVPPQRPNSRRDQAETCIAQRQMV